MRESIPPSPPIRRASLYVHIPFCASLCDYCDFFSVAQSDADEMDAFVGAALDDVEDQLSLFEVDDVPSVYVGGGTPSALGAARVERLLFGLADSLARLRGKPAEFTVEANPESASARFLQACIASGANRISLGAQTFCEESRRQIGRAGSSAQVARGLELAARHFPGAFSADLIAGLPFQTASVLEKDIARLLEFQPAHVSLYSLTLEPETVLGKCALSEGIAALSLPSADEADDLWLAGRDILEQAGFAQYEVSNFALPGKTCAHNIRYWRMENWLGAGPSASGTIIRAGAPCSGQRFTYPSDLAGYLATPRPRINFARREELRAADLMQESLLMGFRYIGGPNTRVFKARFGREIADCIPGAIARWREKGFFADEPAVSLAPSKAGLLFVNSFLRDAFSEMGSGD